MKKLITSIATLVFAGSVGASSESFIYHGFEVKNPDLYGGYSATESSVAVQPGVGDSYGTYTMQNPDQYAGFSRSDDRTAMRPEIGDRTGGLQQGWSESHISYDHWVKGNPDQESSF